MFKWLKKIKEEQEESVVTQDLKKIHGLRTRMGDYKNFKNHVVQEMDKTTDKMCEMLNLKSIDESTCKVLCQMAMAELRNMSNAMDVENALNEKRLNKTVKNSIFFRSIWDADVITEEV